MNILKDLLSEVPQRALELSQHLYDEFEALRNDSRIPCTIPKSKS